jgi:hypothetical protein
MRIVRVPAEHGQHHEESDYVGDGIGQIAPVIAALFQRERGEGNVVEYGGDEA